MEGYTKGELKRLLVLPTGAGKTLIATFIMDRLLGLVDTGRILLISHREEIIHQTVRKIHQQIPNITVGIEQGDKRAQNSRVVVASIQSLARRLPCFDPDEFSLVIIDECHHVFAKTWIKACLYFQSNPKLLLVGMTATPIRSDGRSVKDFFGDPCFEITMEELQAHGYLVPIRYYTFEASLGLSDVKIRQGDFEVTAISRIMNTNPVRVLTLRAWQEKASGQKTIIFCSGVEHAKNLAEDFCKYGVKAATINGKTQNRQQILDDFYKGELMVLTNYGVLTEGFDEPSVGCILLARPTTSPLVYNQCLGRGLRSYPGKTSCTIIDIIDRSVHKLQYSIFQNAGFKRGWRSRGRDPLKEARSVAKIRVSEPTAFLRIKNAVSLEETHSILMELPPTDIQAGLDGIPVVRYKPATAILNKKEAIQKTKSILKGASLRASLIEADPQTKTIQFSITASKKLERRTLLEWHIKNATGWQAEKIVINPKAKTPKRLLRSFLKRHQRIKRFAEQNNEITAHVVGLTDQDFQRIPEVFERESGIKLRLEGELLLW